MNGSTVYSPTLKEQNVTTSSGQLLFATQNGTSSFLTAPNGDQSSLVAPDIILSNGVIHIIDRVLLDASVNTAAASSAFESATSAAGTAPTTTETAPVGVTGTAAGGAGGSGSGGSGTSSPSAALAVRFNLPYVGMAVAAFGAVVGGVVTLA